MAQHLWYYKNEYGPDYEIGLYHGDKSGHVMIYVGQKIVKIDFSVFDNKNYHFQLGSELFNLAIIFGQKNKYVLINENTGKAVPFALKNKYPVKHILASIGICLVLIVLIYFICF